MTWVKKGEQLCLKEFISRYLEITALHPLFTAFISAFLLYLRLVILDERAYLSFAANGLLIIALMVPVRENISTVFWSLAQIFGLWHDGINYATLMLVLLLAFIFFSEALHKILQRFKKSSRMNIIPHKDIPRYQGSANPKMKAKIIRTKHFHFSILSPLFS